MGMKLLYIILALAVLAGAFFALQEIRPELLRSDNRITDFEACVAAGYPVAESYPRQCRTSDGRVFVEEIEEEGTFCTLDAKLCPDGSYVGRVPPSCEFAPCPGE
jgi:hypothetical protein